MTLNFKFRILL